MNPFEKIFSYQLASRLGENQIFTLTTQERSWLKLMLSDPASHVAFSEATRTKLEQRLASDQLLDVQDIVVEKAASRHHTDFPLMLNPLRQIMRKQQGVLLQRRNKYGDEVEPQHGVPWRIEYSAARQEWYLYWFNLDGSAPMTTRLHHIESVIEQVITESQYKAIRKRMEAFVQSERHDITVQVLPIYNRELTRILHAFSCFDKRVQFDEQQQTYSIQLQFTNGEREYVLNRLRFLGKRVQVIEGTGFMERMHETAQRALARYGVTIED